MKYESTEQKILKIIYPPVLYYFISMAVQVMVCFIFVWLDIKTTAIGEAGVTKSMSFLDNVNNIMNEYSVLMNTISASVGLAIFLFIYIRDIKNDNRISLSKELTGMKPFNGAVCYAIGATFGTGISMIITLLPLDNILGSYEDSSKLLMNSNFFVLFITLGIIVPFTEELIYRGIVYNRIKKYLNTSAALSLSAAMFGLFHFNLMQGIYAAILGLVLAVLYEKYHSLTASLLVHMAVNQMTVIFAFTKFSDFLGAHIVAYLITMVAFVGVGGYLFYTETKCLRTDNR